MLNIDALLQIIVRVFALFSEVLQAIDLKAFFDFSWSRKYASRLQNPRFLAQNGRLHEACMTKYKGF